MNLLVVRRLLPQYIITVYLDENYIFGAPLNPTKEGHISRAEEVALCRSIKPPTSLKKVQLIVIGVTSLACLENDRIKEINFKILRISTKMHASPGMFQKSCCSMCSHQLNLVDF